MKITVTAVGKFQKYFPSRTSELDFPGTTLVGFLTWIKSEYGLDVEAYRNVKITHNAVLLRDWKTPLNLEPGDRLSFIPVVAGG